MRFSFLNQTSPELNDLPLFAPPQQGNLAEIAWEEVQLICKGFEQMNQFSGLQLPSCKNRKRKQPMKELQAS